MRTGPVLEQTVPGPDFFSGFQVVNLPTYFIFGTALKRVKYVFWRHSAHDGWAVKLDVDLPRPAAVDVLLHRRIGCSGVTVFPN